MHDKAPCQGSGSDTCTTTASPAANSTRRGMNWRSVLSCPSAPLALSPQVHRLPSAVMAAEAPSAQAQA